MNIEKIAVTTDIENGLDSPMSEHFGHCRAFIVSTVRDGEIIEVESVPNGSHDSCAEPVNRLVDLGVSVLITMGMGMRPFMAAQQVGLTVVKGKGSTAGEEVQNYLAGRSQMMGREGLCAGGDAHSH